MKKHLDISSLERYKNRELLVENKISFLGPDSELSIYDTYKKANRVVLSADQVMYCSMITGKKIMHNLDNLESQIFLPHESYIIKPSGCVEIDFPDARENTPTTCLTVEISKDKINKISEKMQDLFPANIVNKDWEYQSENMHLHHAVDTQNLLNRLVDLFTSNHPDKEVLVGFGISELVTRLLRQQSRDMLLNYAHNAPDSNGVTAVIEYLKSNISKPFDINQLTQKACMSRSALYTAFKQHLGCTPGNFYWQLRLQMAAEMLQKGQSITAVCYGTGFSDPSHFSRKFTQFYGCTPSQYQKTKGHPQKPQHNLGSTENSPFSA
ncbi:MAG: HTH-type transcriptional activator RhaR [Catillopecten margaritatus gill symbiont]|uniref:HTH-type transcriptional activator RhaR n=1 Tax=Catillopecten margaritatus gill symbiont TaxID=3083288 RepID=A0AAU6PI30_9GAMM